VRQHIENANSLYNY